MPKVTALYCRSARNDQEAIDEQIKQLEKYCKDNDIKSFKHYIDINQKGTSPTRPALYLLRRDLEADKIDKVIVTSITRLSRDTISSYSAQALQAFIKSNGAELIALDHSEPDLDNNFFFTDLIEQIKEDE
jgi:DNA invertase Pin-like site-specific DNA recombinase